MEETVLTIQNKALLSVIGSRPFVALPQEEIDRLYASIEVEVTKHSQAKANSSLVQLVAITVLHYNYSWLSCTGETSSISGNNKEASLGFIDYIQPDGHNDIFLDENLKTAACSIVNSNIDTEAGYDIRLGGLLYDDSATMAEYLGLVYIARLRQRGVTSKNGGVSIRFYGTGELQQNQDLFNSWSRILIDNLVAL